MTPKHITIMMQKCVSSLKIEQQFDQIVKIGYFLILKKCVVKQNQGEISMNELVHLYHKIIPI